MMTALFSSSESNDVDNSSHLLWSSSGNSDLFSSTAGEPTILKGSLA